MNQFVCNKKQISIQLKRNKYAFKLRNLPKWKKPKVFFFFPYSNVFRTIENNSFSQSWNVYHKLKTIFPVIEDNTYPVTNKSLKFWIVHFRVLGITC